MDRILPSGKRLIAYCHPWHYSKSPAFLHMLVEPLRARLAIELVPWAETVRPDFSQPMVFCQMPPPPDVLSHPGARVVWLPMWDDARHFSPRWWGGLPENLRIVAFSQPVENRARRAGLRTLRLQFYKNPDDYPAANWSGGHVLFYWNRTGLIPRPLLERLCHELGVRRVIFLSKTDPGFEALHYTLPPLLRGAQVDSHPEFLPPGEYARLLREANFYISPRLHEGVGMAFLEAMASGCAVLAHDDTTMNEYIQQGKNGFLFPCISSPRRERLQSALHARLPGLLPACRPRLALNLKQDWQTLRTTDWQSAGNQARLNQQKGCKTWNSQLNSYAEFLSNW